MLKKHLNLFSLLFLFLITSGCVKKQNTPIVTDTQQESLDNIQLPPQEEYKLSPLDILEISVYREESLKKTVRVSQEGFITYPFVGNIKVTGLTAIQLEQQLTQILGKDYFVNPQVSVFVKEYHSRKIYVTGQVKKPGSYDFTPEKPLTIMEVITLAGGFTDFAAINKTKVIRVVNGVKKIITINISDITNNVDKNQDIILQPNDMVVVPEKIF